MDSDIVLSIMKSYITVEHAFKSIEENSTFKPPFSDESFIQLNKYKDDYLLAHQRLIHLLSRGGENES